MAKKQWIAVVGRNGSGKSAVCSYLQQKGFVCVSLSQILRQLAKEAQQNISRETLIGFGTKLKEQFGKDILAKKALETVEKQNTHVVFDSIRLPEELLFLKKHHVFLLGVASRLDARFKRIKARGEDTDIVDFETFKKQDEHEFLGKSSGQHIQKCLEACDIILNNDDTMQALYKQLDKLL